MVFETVKIRNIAVASAVACFALSGARAAEPLQIADQLANYLAVYDVLLDNTSSKSGLSSLGGRMVYEFRGNHCEGYTTQIRFVTRVTGMDSQTTLHDKQVSSFESANGQNFSFVVQDYTDETLDGEREGSAVNNGSSIKITIKKPDEEVITLGKGQFPTFEMIDIIRYAQEGKTFYHSSVFDGTDEDNSLSSTSTFIGKEGVETATKDDKLWGQFSGMSYWPVTVSYFDDEENPDGLPVYRTSFQLYKNGISRDIIMDYGTFSVRAKLSELVLYDTSAKKGCSAQKPSAPVQ